MEPSQGRMIVLSQSWNQWKQTIKWKRGRWAFGVMFCNLNATDQQRYTNLWPTTICFEHRPKTNYSLTDCQHLAHKHLAIHKRNCFGQLILVHVLRLCISILGVCGWRKALLHGITLPLTFLPCSCFLCSNMYLDIQPLHLSRSLRSVHYNPMGYILQFDNLSLSFYCLFE